MSAHPLPKAMHEGPLSRQVASNQAAQDCLLTMGEAGSRAYSRIPPRAGQGRDGALSAARSAGQACLPALLVTSGSVFGSSRSRSSSSAGHDDTTEPLQTAPACVSDPQPVSPCPRAAGMTSENVAEVYGVSRQEQDDFAARSHTLAAAAQVST